MKPIKMHAQISLLLISSLLLTLSGCGELSYKRGATASDFQHSKQACSSKHKIDTEIESCLAQSGWLVVDMNKSMVTEASLNTTSDSLFDGEKLPANKSTRPLDTSTIGSWWKAGATANSLSTDSEACTQQLGEQHQPQHNMTLVTLGLLDCMKTKGWFALKQ
ncbi:MAG: hypothetical protein COA90_06980 [Gammaproteobacteria bacterium]|nr:MAG: hypothetical protein COA90_06980 [Gammaproteobacteria bacterium]